MDKKIDLLCKIANTFNDRNILWAIGGSMLLYFQHLTEDVHDLDIMVEACDGIYASELLSSMGERLPVKKDERFGSKIFERFVIDGIDVDLIGDFSIFKGNQEYVFPIRKERLEEMEFHQTKLYFERMEDWIERYRLMGREEKAVLIEKALYEQKN